MQVGLQGDINGDHLVNSSDLMLLRQAYGSVPDDPNWNQNADLNTDRMIAGEDLNLLAASFGVTE